jgi:hypothetical protein
MNKLILILIAFTTTSLFAQKDSISFFRDKLNYYGAYSGNNLINPGLNFGADYNLFLKEKQKQKKKKQKIITHQLDFNGNIGFYWDPLNHWGIYTNYGISYLKTKTKGFQFHTGLNPLGYYRSFLPETYEVDENWEVEKVFLPGRSYYAPSFTLGFGHTRPDKFLNAWSLKFKTLILTPYNGHTMPLFFVEYGYCFNLN